jgi:ornithine cyclodeaminase/alanine dehydrogenase
VLPLERAFIWSRSGAERFAQKMREALSIEVQPVDELSQGTLESDVIVTCTPARKWFLGRGHVRPGTFIAAVGSDSPDKQELEPALGASSSLVPDLVQQAARVGELRSAIAARLMRPDQIRGELGAVIAGMAPRRTDDAEIIIFDSTGTALQDCAAAAAIYEKAQHSRSVRQFEFYD